MDNLIFTVNAVIPLFAVVWLGYLVRKLGFLSDATISEMNRLCFRVLIPCNMFITVLKANFGDDIQLRFVAFLACSFLVGAGLLVLIIPRFIPSRGQAGSLIHCAFRSNVVLLGIPLAENILSPEGGAKMALAISLLVPMFNVLGVVVLSMFADREGETLSLPKLGRDIVTNPLIIAALLAFLVNFSGFALPQIMMKPLADLSVCGVTIAMLCLGAQFNLQSAFSHAVPNVLACSIKLVLMPFVFTALGAAFGLRGHELGVVFIAHAAPSAATSGMLAESMGCDGILAGEITLLTTAFSVFTLMSGTMILKTLGAFV